MAKKSRFSFTLAEDLQGQRHAYRANVHGINVRLNNGKTTYKVVDISVSGCAFQMPQKFLAEGNEFILQLEVSNRVILAGLRAKVIRSLGNGLVACNFINLSERQEVALDKLVLEIQKRIIEVSKR